VRLWFRWGVVEIRVGNEGSRCGRREVRSGKREDEDVALGIKRKSWSGVCGDEEERCWSWERKFKARGRRLVFSKR
jgi:hypothetical protein